MSRRDDEPESAPSDAPNRAPDDAMADAPEAARANVKASADAPRVVITGFMAAGKTTVARALAARLGCDAVDTDERAAALAGRTPAEIIDAEGEARFREIEARALREILAAAGPLVVALGGGAWTLPENRAMIAARGCRAVWLDAPFELCWQRITASPDDPARPFARDPARARALYDVRRAAYALARFHLPVADGDTPDEIADRIARSLASS